MNKLSYKAIITGKCVGHKYDSDKKEIPQRKNRKIKDLQKRAKLEKNIPTRREIP